MKYWLSSKAIFSLPIYLTVSFIFLLFTFIFWPSPTRFQYSLDIFFVFLRFIFGLIEFANVFQLVNILDDYFALKFHDVLVIIAYICYVIIEVILIVFFAILIKRKLLVILTDLVFIV
jgi:hypothetical protein